VRGRGRAEGERENPKQAPHPGESQMWGSIPQPRGHDPS